MICKHCLKDKPEDQMAKPLSKSACRECSNRLVREWRAARKFDPDAPRCSVDECPEVATAGRYCSMHSNRFYRDGDAGTADRRKQSGDSVGYAAVHARIAKENGPAVDYQCECGRTADEWAYVGDDPRRFSIDLSQYVPMCHYCHRRLDAKNHGEANPMVKLTDEQVDDLVRRYRAGGVSQAEVAAQFGVSQTLVSKYVRSGGRGTPS